MGDDVRRIINKNMANKGENSIIPLGYSIEQSITVDDYSFIGDVIEAIADGTMKEGLLRDFPFVSTLIGLSKVKSSVSDKIFARKLAAFLYGLKGASAEERKEAIENWNIDTNYRDRMGETLVHMINRCDDTYKAQWLSKLFYEFVLKENNVALFFRAEKILASLSVGDILTFLYHESFEKIQPDDFEIFGNSGLYKWIPSRAVVHGTTLELEDDEILVTEIGRRIHDALCDYAFDITK